ncbi:NADPH:quinone oxidoreductase family protein [Rhodococcus aerolatus]
MRAWRVHELGEPGDVLRLEDVADPEPGPGEVVVDVAAAATNFADVLVCRGEYQVKPPRPFTPGMEVAGTVTAAGEGAAFAVGDRVIGQPAPPRGGYAEKTVLPAASTYAWPDGMSAAQAAGFFVTYQTGYCALHHRAQLQAGETLLVNAALGGVGTAALQLGLAAGATVIATAGGPEKCAQARALGAHHVVDYRSEDLVERVRELTDGLGADIVYDPVGGDTFDAVRRVVAFEGRLLVIGFASGRIPDAPANHVLVKNYSIVGVHWGRYKDVAPELVRQWHDALVDLSARGLIDPVVGEEHPFDDLVPALDRLAARKTTGKVVLVR